MIILGPLASLASGHGGDTTAPPASGSLATVTAYVVTRDTAGVPQAGQTVYFRLVHSLAPGAHDTTTRNVTSDDNGVAVMLFERGGTYQYWRSPTATRTVAVSDTTSDPFELPAVSAGE